MSFGSKRILAGMGVGLVMLVAYLVFAFGAKAPASDDVRGWALAMLIFIGISVVVMIVVQILFHILFSIGVAIKQRDDCKVDSGRVERIISATVGEDERDKQISLMATRIGYRVSGFGSLFVLVVIACGLPMVLALHLLFGACFLGNFVEGIASVFYHERGFQHA